MKRTYKYLPEQNKCIGYMGSKGIDCKAQHERTLDCSEAKILVIVPGHAVYVGTEAEHSKDDRYWIGGLPGEAKYYREHALAGVETAGKNAKYLLVFSGGCTRDGTEMSEAQSYLNLCSQNAWLNIKKIESMATTEELARDSFENVVFSVCKFLIVTKRMPEEIVICSWGFKEDRYRFHADTLGLAIKRDAVRYLGVNDPEGDALAKALEGEKRTMKDFILTPHGDSGILLAKRKERDKLGLGDKPYKDYKVQEAFTWLRLAADPDAILREA
jgi:hypothetical protein